MWWIGVVVCAAAACATGDDTVPTSEAETQSELTVSTEPRLSKEILVIAVRHAERSTDHPTDPSLSPAGHLRAQALAAVLEHTHISKIYTTQYLRTQQTAIPTSTVSGTPITLRPVDASNIATYSADLANEIRYNNRGQAVLVVGHSNTIPKLVNILAGVPIPPIAEPEYNRIYTITIGPEVRVVSARY